MAINYYLVSKDKILKVRAMLFFSTRMIYNDLADFMPITYGHADEMTK